jgi:2-deoxy-D-gluconate 3-dehydrogenase
MAGALERVPVLDSFRLLGKVAIVTGASRGLGKAMALGLGEAGASLVLVSRTESIHRTQEEIERAGGKAVALELDLGERDTPDRVVEEALRAFGAVDILVNNAGVVRRSPAIDLKETDWDEVLAVNTKAVFFMAQAAAREMIERRAGKIINLASTTYTWGAINVAAYAASKGALVQMTKTMSNEWAPFGLQVNALAPGLMVTDQSQATREDPVKQAAFMARLPAGRWGTPEDMKGPVVFLASAASDYVTGTVLVVDGGFLAR